MSIATRLYDNLILNLNPTDKLVSIICNSLFSFLIVPQWKTYSQRLDGMEFLDSSGFWIVLRAMLHAV